MQTAFFSSLRWVSSPALVAMLLVSPMFMGCDKTNEVDQSNNVNNTGCSTPATDLAKLCPAGTSLEVSSGIGVSGEVCPGGEGEVKDSQGKTTGVCRTIASCAVRCKATCACGVKAATASSVECAECPTCEPGATSCSGDVLLLCGPDKKQTQTDCAAQGGKLCSAALGQCVAPKKCGNSVCEADESESTCPQDCKKECGDGVCSGVETASTCPQDCAKATCGNGKCELGENSSCPQDCGTVCVSGAKSCVGSKLLICQPDGKAEREFNCSDFGQTCGGGACVPPEVCGNGACEASDPVGCVDCATQCGDGSCDPGETVETCSQDCKKATCGDGVCLVSEAGTSCADCAASCGNGQCDSGETRSTCPADCGYCGDGKCPSNVETSVQPAPDGIEYCPQDCVKTGACSADADCDDQIDCTIDQCVGGACVYDVPPVGADKVCSAGQLCVKFFGCCPDADGDGYPCCGGGSDGKGCKAVSAESDCADLDKNTRPNAPELCGGPDTNCNGTNEAVVDKELVYITSDQNNKAGIGYAFDGKNYLFGWVGKPNGLDAIVVAMADADGKLVVGPTILSEDPLYASGLEVRVSPSPDHQGFAVAWSNDTKGAETAPLLRMTWVDKQLKPLTWPPLQIKSASAYAYGKYSYRFQLQTLQDHYMASGSALGFDNYRRYHTTLVGPAEAPVATIAPAPTDYGNPFIDGVSVLDDKFVFVGNFFSGKPALFTASLDGSLSPTVKINWAPDGEPFSRQYSDYTAFDTGNGPRTQALRFAGASAVGILSSATQANTSGLWYSVVNLGGDVIFQAQVNQNASAVPVAMALAPDPSLNDPSAGTLGMLARAGNNLIFLSRGPDGAQVVKDAIISGGTGLSDPTLIHDGKDFVALWMQPKGGSNVPQVVMSKIRCK